MTLRALPGGADRGQTATGPRILATGAPPSPGPVPNRLAAHLKFGEALVWWGSKDAIEKTLLLITLGAAALALVFVSAFAPQFWTQPWSGLWPPLAALLSPTAFVFAREWVNRKAVLVTDTSVVEVRRNDETARVAFDNIVSVRRDPLRGGVVLRARQASVQIPGALLQDARAAIASQRRGSIQASEIDDPAGWLP